MIIFREHPKFFLGLKCTQLLFTILVMTFEITQYVVYGKNYVLPGQRNDWFDKAQDEGDSNGEPKLWLLVVCTLTISSLVFSLIFFKRCWEKGSCLWTEILFSALWLSAGLSNLDPVYRGTNHLNCRSPSLRAMPTMQFICDMWVTSLIFGWFILGTFMLTTFMNWQISKERRQKIHWVGRSSLSNPSSFNNNKLHRKSLVLPYLSPIPQPIVTVKTDDPASDELEKGGVPELLLQSGLPADKRMSLKIVLPQSSPLGQGLDLSVSDDDDSPTQDNNPSNDGLNFSPPPVNGSTLTLPDVVQPEPSNPNFLVIPSKQSTEVSSLHEVPL